VSAPQQGQRPVLGSAHRPLLDRHQIVVTGEVQPAVHDVERELFRERAAVFPGVRGGGVGRHANLARETERGLAGEGDDIGRLRISEKIGVEPGEVRIGEQGHGKFTGRTAAAEARGVRIENVDDLPERATVDAEARMAVGDGEAAHGLEKG